MFRTSPIFYTLPHDDFSDPPGVSTYYRKDDSDSASASYWLAGRDGINKFAWMTDHQSRSTSRSGARVMFAISTDRINKLKSSQSYLTPSLDAR